MNRINEGNKQLSWIDLAIEAGALVEVHPPEKSDNLNEILESCKKNYKLPSVSIEQLASFKPKTVRVAMGVVITHDGFIRTKMWNVFLLSGEEFHMDMNFYSGCKYIHVCTITRNEYLKLGLW